MLTNSYISYFYFIFSDIHDTVMGCVEMLEGAECTEEDLCLGENRSSGHDNYFRFPADSSQEEHLLLAEDTGRCS